MISVVGDGLDRSIADRLLEIVRETDSAIWLRVSRGIEVTTANSIGVHAR
ncbi:MAG: hypothetical protein KGQ60_07410 [Planctomycetes bacterium]|nr:hypothetical protein [Planctomycetota bacterium]